GAAASGRTGCERRIARSTGSRRGSPPRAGTRRRDTHLRTRPSGRGCLQVQEPLDVSRMVVPRLRAEARRSGRRALEPLFAEADIPRRPAGTARRARGDAMTRTLAIGLDGCSWNVLEPLLDTGQLPHLAQLRDTGAHGVLESTIPFYTGPAWASYATGTTPAAHGIYDFMMLRPDGTLTVAKQADLKRPTYYHQLGREHRRTILVN